MTRSRVIATLAVAVCVLAAATPAAAVTTYAWAGGGEQWSVAHDWQGDVAPSGTVGVISLGDQNGACAAPCYVNDDVSGLATGELDIDLSQGYYDYGGDPLTINGNGGTPNLGIDATTPNGGPATGQYYSGDTVITGGINLGADQTWDISGYPGGVGLGVGSVSGNQTLDLELNDGAIVTANNLNVGAITVNGNGTLALNDYYDGIGFANNNGATLGGGVTLAAGASLNIDSAADVSSGPITVSGGSNALQPIINVGSGTGTGNSHDTALSVQGDVTLDQWADLYLDLDGTSSPWGYSSLATTGNLALNGATVYLEQGTSGVPPGCAAIAPGTSFPVISTQSNGSITGDLTYFDASGNFDTLSPGQTSAAIPLQGDYCPGTGGLAVLNYGADAITATVVSAPADGSSAPVISGTATVGGSLTLTSPGSWSAYPSSITYAYQWLACTTTSCAYISGATGSSFSPTAAQAGDWIGVAVAATNAAGSTIDYSNLLGPVPVPVAPTPQSPITQSPTPQSPTPGSTTPTQSSTVPVATSVALTTAEVSAALQGIVTHPSGKKAVATLVKRGVFTTSFDAPGGGSVSIVWRTRERIGSGKARTHRTVVVAVGSAHAGSASRIQVEIRLTAAARSLLKKKPRGLVIVATEEFTPASGVPTSVTRKFSLSR